MYLVYLDESGNSRIDNPSVREQSDFFVLGGLIIKEELFVEYDARFKAFKNEVFPRELATLPIHAVELNHISKNERSRYAGRLTDEQGVDILKKLYQHIASYPIEAIAVVIDNHNLRKKYVSPENPYLLSYEFLMEKLQKIVFKRRDTQNHFAVINLAKSSTKLASNIKRIHAWIIENGTTYVKDYSNLLNQVNIQPTEKSSFYEIADLICYAYQRSYYVYLCQHLNMRCFDEGYLKLIKPICSLQIGKVLINGEIWVKVFPEPRFEKKKTE